MASSRLCAVVIMLLFGAHAVHAAGKKTGTGASKSSPAQLEQAYTQVVRLYGHMKVTDFHNTVSKSVAKEVLKVMKDHLHCCKGNEEGTPCADCHATYKLFEHTSGWQGYYSKSGGRGGLLTIAMLSAAHMFFKHTCLDCSTANMIAFKAGCSDFVIKTRSMIQNARSVSKIQRVGFNLTMVWLINTLLAIRYKCQLTGAPLTIAICSHFCASLNRVITTGGYTTDNVVFWLLEFNVPSSNDGAQPTTLLLISIINHYLRVVVMGVEAYKASAEVAAHVAASERLVTTTSFLVFMDDRANGSRKSDENKGRRVGDVTGAALLTMLAAQFYLCNLTFGLLDLTCQTLLQPSPDRINNKDPHDMVNIRIVGRMLNGNAVRNEDNICWSPYKWATFVLERQTIVVLTPDQRAALVAYRATLAVDVTL